MTDPKPHILTGHDMAHDRDVLVRLYDDGTGELATRPGTEERQIIWSPPVVLLPEQRRGEDE